MNADPRIQRGHGDDGDDDSEIAECCANGEREVWRFFQRFQGHAGEECDQRQKNRHQENIWVPLRLRADFVGARRFVVAEHRNLITNQINQIALLSTIFTQ